MPSAKGPRLFNYRSSSSQYLPRKSLAQIVCLLIGISGLLFGFVAISKMFLGQNSCKFGEPRSISVVWKTVESNDDGGGDSEASLLFGDGKRYTVMGFVGIFTGFGSVGRRRALRQTWLPPDREGLQRYEPLAYLLGKEYFLHAYGPIYALSAKVVRSLVSLRNDSFRMFSNEDVTIGSWMLAMNVNHENNHALCSSECTSSSIAVWDIPRCSGLCNPEKKMLELHKIEACSGSPGVHFDE